MENRFLINNLDITVPIKVITQNVADAMSKGKYERKETNALLKHLRHNDKYLDVGGGVGFTGCIAARIVSPKNTTIIEANPILIPAINLNLKNNNLDGAQIIHGAVSPSKTQQTTILSHGDGFWAGNTMEGRRKLKHQISVPVVNFSQLLNEIQPTFIGMDIEGTEMYLFQTPLPTSVRFISMETHPGIYGEETIETIMENLFSLGFHYVSNGSNGSHICFEKAAY